MRERHGSRRCKWTANHLRVFGSDPFDEYSSLVIDHLASQHAPSPTKFAYIYCDYSQKDSQSPTALLANILQQAVRQIGAFLPPPVKDLYNLHRKYETRPTIEQITSVLRTILSHQTPFHVVVDALDECAGREETALDFITTVLEIGPQVQLLCTSRPSTIFDAYFRKSTRIDISAHGEDIRAFIGGHIKQQSRLSRHVHSDPKLGEEIADAIIRESQGM